MLKRLLFIGLVLLLVSSVNALYTGNNPHISSYAINGTTSAYLIDGKAPKGLAYHANAFSLTQIQKDIPYLSELQVNLIRWDIYWYAIESTEGGINYSFLNQMKEKIDLLGSNGFYSLIILSSPPDWAYSKCPFLDQMGVARNYSWGTGRGTGNIYCEGYKQSWFNHLQKIAEYFKQDNFVVAYNIGNEWRFSETNKNYLGGVQHIGFDSDALSLFKTWAEEKGLELNVPQSTISGDWSNAFGNVVVDSQKNLGYLWLKWRNYQIAQFINESCQKLKKVDPNKLCIAQANHNTQPLLIDYASPYLNESVDIISSNNYYATSSPVVDAGYNIFSDYSYTPLWTTELGDNDYSRGNQQQTKLSLERQLALLKNSAYSTGFVYQFNNSTSDTLGSEQTFGLGYWTGPYVGSSSRKEASGSFVKKPQFDTYKNFDASVLLNDSGYKSPELMIVTMPGILKNYENVFYGKPVVRMVASFNVPFASTTKEFIEEKGIPSTAKLLVCDGYSNQGFSVEFLEKIKAFVNAGGVFYCNEAGLASGTWNEWGSFDKAHANYSISDLGFGQRTKEDLAQTNLSVTFNGKTLTRIQSAYVDNSQANNNCTSLGTIKSKTFDTNYMYICDYGQGKFIWTKITSNEGMGATKHFTGTTDLANRNTDWELFRDSLGYIIANYAPTIKLPDIDPKTFQDQKGLTYSIDKKGVLTINAAIDYDSATGTFNQNQKRNYTITGLENYDYGIGMFTGKVYCITNGTLLLNDVTESDIIPLQKGTPPTQTTGKITIGIPGIDIEKENLNIAIGLVIILCIIEGIIVFGKNKGEKGQGSMEFLLIIGGAIVIGAIVLVVMSGAANPVSDNAKQTTLDALCARYSSNNCEEIHTEVCEVTSCKWELSENKCTGITPVPNGCLGGTNQTASPEPQEPECTPNWQDSSQCNCEQNCQNWCEGTKTQTDGCGNMQTVSCALEQINCEQGQICGENGKCTTTLGASCALDSECSTGEKCCSEKCTILSCALNEQCNDNIACTTDTCTNTGCEAECIHIPITACSGTTKDGCCPAGCIGSTDADCPGSVVCTG